MDEIEREVYEKTKQQRENIENLKRNLEERKVSLEMIKRVLFKLIDFNVYRDNINTNKIYRIQQQQLLKGDSQELINGDNLELNSKLVHEIFTDLNLDSEHVLTIIVIGR